MLKYLSIVVVLVLASCASVPVISTPAPIPEGMVLVPKEELAIVIKNYNQLVDKLEEFNKCREWQDKMFF